MALVHQLTMAVFQDLLEVNPKTLLIMHGVVVVPMVALLQTVVNKRLLGLQMVTGVHGVRGVHVA